MLHDNFGIAYSKLTNNKYYICANRDRTAWKTKVREENKIQINVSHNLRKTTFLTPEVDYSGGWRIYPPNQIPFSIRNIMLSTDSHWPPVTFIYKF